MDLTLIRKWPKHNYIIGQLFINGEFFCNTLEPSLNRYPFPGIPKGTYEVKLAVSSKFHGSRPYVLNVPGRFGIMIHEGNQLENTQGCILMGENKYIGKVMNSRTYVNSLIGIMKSCRNREERVFLTIRDE